MNMLTKYMQVSELDYILPKIEFQAAKTIFGSIYELYLCVPLDLQRLDRGLGGFAIA